MKKKEVLTIDVIKLNKKIKLFSIGGIILAIFYTLAYITVAIVFHDNELIFILAVAVLVFIAYPHVLVMFAVANALKKKKKRLKELGKQNQQI